MRDEMTDSLVALLIAVAILAVVLILFVACWRRTSFNAKVQCYLCEDEVAGREWDEHRADCTRVYARHIESLPELKVCQLQWAINNLMSLE